VTASEPVRPREPSEAVPGLTITEAASAFGVSVSTIRRRIAQGDIPGAVKVPGPKGSEYRIPPASLEALGYVYAATREAVTVEASRAGLEVENLRRELSEAKATADRLRAERDAKAREVELLAASVEDLRTALRKLPDAIPAATPEPSEPVKPRRRWWGRR
jgi:excisionase family DNA binding protein